MLTVRKMRAVYHGRSWMQRKQPQAWDEAKCDCRIIPKRGEKAEKGDRAGLHRQIEKRAL